MVLIAAAKTPMPTDNHKLTTIAVQSYVRTSLLICS